LFTLVTIKILFEALTYFMSIAFAAVTR